MPAQGIIRKRRGGGGLDPGGIASTVVGITDGAVSEGPDPAGARPGANSLACPPERG